MRATRKEKKALFGRGYVIGVSACAWALSKILVCVLILQKFGESGFVPMIAWIISNYVLIYSLRFHLVKFVFGELMGRRKDM